jgi:hypothetical protein
MLRASGNKFRKGDIVKCLRDKSLGSGSILEFGSEETIIYVGSNEWITEFTPFAIVLFGKERKFIALKELIKASKVETYESLCLGDLIVFGKLKRFSGVIIDKALRNSKRQSVVDKTITVLVGAKKKKLAVTQDITIIQRFSECSS